MPAIYPALLKNRHLSKTLIIHNAYIFFLSFQNTVTIETGTSDLHKMAIKEKSKTKGHSIKKLYEL